MTHRGLYKTSICQISFDKELVQGMKKSFDIRSELDKFLKSQKTNHDTLIKTLFGRSKKVNTKTHVLTWLSENPEGIGSFKNWLKKNGGKPILDKINVIASDSAKSKENTEDKKFYQAWSTMVAEDGVSSMDFADFKQFVAQRFQSQDKDIKDLTRLVAAQGMYIEELQRELGEKKLEVMVLIQKMQEMEQKLESADIDKNKLVEKLKEERRQKGVLANKFHEMDKKLKAVMDDNVKLEEALRAEKEHKVNSETGKTSKEEINVEALNVKAVEEAFNAKKAILLQLSDECKKINELYFTDRSYSTCTDYMVSSDDAANYIPPSHTV